MPTHIRVHVVANHLQCAIETDKRKESFPLIGKDWKKGRSQATISSIEIAARKLLLDLKKRYEDTFGVLL